MNPANADPIPLFVYCCIPACGSDMADNFVARHDRKRWRRCPAFDFVEFRMADTADRHSDEYLSLGGHRRCQFYELKRLRILSQQGSRG